MYKKMKGGEQPFMKTKCGERKNLEQTQRSRNREKDSKIIDD